MNYREAMEYVERTSRYGISPGLDSIRELCRRMGDPQKGMKYVHVAGTNGKGSVSAYAVSVLVRGGYRVGRYLSPALFDYREEIQVNNRYITRKSLCRGMELLKEICRPLCIKFEEDFCMLDAGKYLLGLFEGWNGDGAVNFRMMNSLFFIRIAVLDKLLEYAMELFKMNKEDKM